MIGIQTAELQSMFLVHRGWVIWCMAWTPLLLRYLSMMPLSKAEWAIKSYLNYAGI